MVKPHHMAAIWQDGDDRGGFAAEFHLPDDCNDSMEFIRSVIQDYYQQNDVDSRDEHINWGDAILEMDDPFFRERGVELLWSIGFNGSHVVDHDEIIVELDEENEEEI